MLLDVVSSLADERKKNESDRMKGGGWDGQVPCRTSLTVRSAKSVSFYSPYSRVPFCLRVRVFFGSCRFRRKWNLGVGGRVTIDGMQSQLDLWPL